MRLAMLDDATSGRPSWNDDIARDVLRNAVAYCFQTPPRLKMAGTFARQHLPCLWKNGGKI